jgi:transcriptional regulator with XRE-family HTH domain
MSGTTIDRTVQGNRIKTARKVLGLTQQELADYVSDRVPNRISNNIISEIEKGNRGVWNDEMYALVEILGQDREWLEGTGGEFNLPMGVYDSSTQLALAV